MSKRSKKVDKRQLSLLDLLTMMRGQSEASAPEGEANVKETLRRSLNDAIAACALSRHQIAGQMSHLLGVDVTKTMLDTWTAESKEGHRFPAEYLPAFCRATGSRAPLEVLAEAAGMFAMPGPEALRAEIQRLSEEERRARAEKRKRELFLAEMEGR
jgi:hypothetical protein